MDYDSQCNAVAPVVLQAEGFRVGFPVGDMLVWAVDEVDLTLHEGETVGIVGESGCGKSVFSQSILRLLEHEQSVVYEGSVGDGVRNYLDIDLKDMREARGTRLAMVFQDPLSSFDPLIGVGVQIAEAIQSHGSVDKETARRRTVQAMDAVGIQDAERRFRSRPDSFSGGQLQRLMIAMAMINSPRVLIADEPTTALDTTTQARILAQLRDLVRETNMAMLFLSHDLYVVAEVCERVCVMYAGQFVEMISTDRLFTSPAHPYTQALIDAVPSLTGPKLDRLPAIPGAAPALGDRPAGCRFCARCPKATKRCETEEPALVPLLDERGGGDGAMHMVRCWYPNKGVAQ